VETLLGGGRKLWEHDDWVEGNCEKIMSGWKENCGKILILWKENYGNMMTAQKELEGT
jgi:hypothetical protein